MCNLFLTFDFTEWREYSQFNALNQYIFIIHGQRNIIESNKNIIIKRSFLQDMPYTRWNSASNLTQTLV